jgi:SPX domain protein involved in polyphosphate accumulation
MNIIVLSLILVFSYILLSGILNKTTFREYMTNKDSIVKNIGENKGSISNLKQAFNKTLQRAKELYDKLDAAKSQSSLNDDAKSHPSIQSLNLKEKKDTSCEEFQTMNETIFNSLTEKHDNNKVEFSTIDAIINQINEQIKKIKNKL